MPSVFGTKTARPLARSPEAGLSGTHAPGTLAHLHAMTSPHAAPSAPAAPVALIQLRLDDSSLVEHGLPAGTFILGRDPSCDLVIPSKGVSRKHIQISLSATGQHVQIEDLGSTAGTFMGASRIQEKTRLPLPCQIRLGHLPVRIRSAEHSEEDEACRGIGLSLSAADRHAPSVEGIGTRAQQRLELLYELPLRFAEETDSNRLFTLILERVTALIPGAVRGALLLKDGESQNLALKASISPGTPAVSRSLILRAAQDQQGFIWGGHPSEQADASASIAALGIQTAMYAPLVWKKETIGVLFFDNPNRPDAFGAEDLRFLISVAHYAAAAVANQLLQSRLEQNNRTLEHLLTNFSPAIRNQLLEKSRSGRLQPGGAKSRVTVLFSDLRGFTRTAAVHDSAVVVEMLNDYFQVLGAEIFAHDGTIDKFIGDGILAVFGSPEPDPDHARKAAAAAVAMQRRISEVNRRRSESGLVCCEMGIGICTGEVLHGFIGTEDCLQYTVIGDTVNMASRYCDGAKAGEVLLSPLAAEAIAGALPLEPSSIPTKHEGFLNAFRLHWEPAEKSAAS